MNIPNEGIDMLLNYLHYFSNNDIDKIFRLIKNNIPNNYDFSKLSIEFQNKLSNINNYIIAYLLDNKIHITNTLDNSIIVIEHTDNYKILSLTFIKNEYLILYTSCYIFIYDVITGKEYI